MVEKMRKQDRNGADTPEWMDDMAEVETPAVEEAPPEPEIDPTGRVEDPGGNRFHWGTGRRKSSYARVRLRPGSGQFFINGRPLVEYMPSITEREMASAPVRDLKVDAKVDVFVNALGGGYSGQAGAVRMGLARALEKLYPDAHEFLRRHGHLSRDSRMVERKKYGKAGARRSFQWVKR